MEELLKQVKDSMRIKHSALDDSIESDIEAAALDLKRVGVQPFIDESEEIKKDKLIRKAMELFCKGQADYQGKGDKYTVAYEKMRDALSLCGEYNE